MSVVSSSTAGSPPVVLVVVVGTTGAVVVTGGTVVVGGARMVVGGAVVGEVGSGASAQAANRTASTIVDHRGKRVTLQASRNAAGNSGCGVLGDG
jgi:hypothetical protein